MKKIFFGPLKKIHKEELTKEYFEHKNKTQKDFLAEINKYGQIITDYDAPCSIRGYKLDFNNLLPTDNEYTFIQDPLINGKCWDTYDFPIKNCYINFSDKSSFQGTAWFKNTEEINDDNFLSYRCIYNADNFGPNELFQYIEKNQNSIKTLKDQENKNLIYNKVCFDSTTKNCPIDPETKKPFKKCMNLRAENRIGYECALWSASQPVKEINDYKKRWCVENKDSEDCKCLNRKYDDDFIEQEKMLGHHNAECWYFPCKDNNGSYLTIDEPHECHDTICQDIFNFKNVSGNLNMNNIKTRFNCGENKNKDIPEDDDNEYYNNNFYNNIKIVVLGFLIFFLFYILK